MDTELSAEVARVSDTSVYGANGVYGGFERVNPYVAERLHDLNLDKTFTRANGVYLWDSDGRRYLDFTSQYGVLALGHNPEPVIRRVISALSQSKPVFCQPSILADASELTNALLRHTPWPNGFCTFTNSGTESVEAAIKIARSCTGRKTIINFSDAFHGKTTGALVLTANPRYREPYRLEENWVITVPRNDAIGLIRTLDRHALQIAAVMLEPVMGEGGVLFHDPELIRIVNAKCKEHGILIVADEVQTGFGRLGAIFGCTEIGLEPDIICLAKALGGGVVPIGAVLYRALPQIRKFHETHSSTFAGNGLGCTAALATLEELSTPGFLDNVRKQGRWLLQEVEAIAARYPVIVRKVRGLGLLIGMEFQTVPPPRATPLYAACMEQELLALVFASYIANVEGVRLFPSLNGSSTVRIQPPLNIERAVLLEFLQTLDRTLKTFNGLLLGPVIGPALGSSMTATTATTQRYLFRDRRDRYDFAFIGHPLKEADYAKLETSFESFGPETLRRIGTLARSMDDAFWGGNLELELKGRRLTGCFLTIPMTPDQLMDVRSDRGPEFVNSAVRLAARLGAKHVGLGAFSSVVSAGGALVDVENITVTNGNSLTAVAAVRQSIESLRPRNSLDCRALIVGGLGSVGQKVALLAARAFGHITVVGNPKREIRNQAARLRALLRTIYAAYAPIVNELPRNCAAAEVIKAFTSMPARTLDAAAIPPSLPVCFESNLNDALTTHDVAFLAANCTSPFLAPEDISKFSVVIDLARPLSVRSGIPLPASTTYRRGGMIRFDGAPDLSYLGIEEAGLYSCLGEVIMLSREGIVTQAGKGMETDFRYLSFIEKLMTDLDITPTLDAIT